jgi:hypothetical protein
MGDSNAQISVRAVPSLDSGALAEVMRRYQSALNQHRVTIDRLNVYPVPDGDTGTNMALTLAAVSEELLQSGAGRGDICRAISHGALMGARGNSGVIVSQLLRGFAATLAPGDDDPDSDPPIDAELLAAGLVAASAAADSAVMRPVEGTILSVARASAQAAQSALEALTPQERNAGATALAAVLESAKRAGQQALEATPQQLPVLADAGVVDAGAAGYLLLLDALLSVVDGRPLPDEVELPAEVAAVIAHGNAGASLSSDPVDPVAEQRAELHSHLEPGDGAGHDVHDLSGTRYEVMFLLAAPDENIDPFKVAWDALGDSIVMVGGDGLWNCHIHTDDIGPVIEAGIDAGRPHRIQITDLHEQVAGLGAHAGQHGAHGGQHGAHAGQHGAAEPAQRRLVGCAVVAVSPAAGLDELFASLGCHELVTGGQTMNPSTAELLAAIHAAPSEQVVVLPNNSNIVPVARQAGEHADKTVTIVATTSVPAGLAALIGYDPGASADDNAASMGDAASAVSAGEVTQAVRDTTAPTGQVAAGQWIGLDESGIVATGETAGAAAIGLLGHMLQPAHEILTLIEGAGAQPAQTDEVASWVSQHWPDVEVERHVGGQDHYPYLFGIE